MLGVCAPSMILEIVKDVTIFYFFSLWYHLNNGSYHWQLKIGLINNALNKSSFIAVASVVQGRWKKVRLTCLVVLRAGSHYCRDEAKWTQTKGANIKMTNDCLDRTLISFVTFLNIPTSVMWIGWHTKVFGSHIRFPTRGSHNPLPTN